MRLQLFCAVLATLLVLPAVPRAQRPVFEVTSVKSNKTAARPTRYRVGADATPTGCCSRFVAMNASVRMLLNYVYSDLLESEIVGGPAWIDTLRFDVEGRPDAASIPVPSAQIRLMLRALLEDRFGLTTHTERREGSVYQLVLAKDPPILKVSTQPPERRTAGFKAEAGGFISEGTASSISWLIDGIQPFTTRRILDKTGLTGVYDFELKFTPENIAASAVTTDTSFPIIFTALQEQVGLKLEGAKAQVEVLVIDSVRMPEEN